MHTHHYKSSAKRRLLIALLVNLLVMLLEFIGGIFTHSLALLSDAGHMFTHIFALGTSYFAIVLASRKANDRKTFGYFRAEILATFVNSIFLFAVVLLVVYQAVKLIFNPVEIREKEMVAVAVIGLLTNLVSVFLLKTDSKKDINIRAAFIHVISDTASSMLVILGGIAIYFKKIYFLDPVLGFIISIFIFVWAWRLFRESVHILLEGTPRGIDIRNVRESLIQEIAEIRDIHDIHIWEITGHLYTATLHIQVDNITINEGGLIIKKIRNLLEDRYAISHCNVQLETLEGACAHENGI
jgi:cobalt-zinc-cadmium efflux system protein